MKTLLRVLTWPFRLIFGLIRLALRATLAPFRWLFGRLRAVREFFTQDPGDASLADTLGPALEGGEGFKQFLSGIADHIEALRRHLFRSVLALAITTTFSFLFAERMLQVLAVPLGSIGLEQWIAMVRLPPAEAFAALLQVGAQGLTKLLVIEPTEGIGVFMRVALLAGVALAMPWIVFELYLFVAPGLMPPNRVRLIVVIPLATALFLLGIAFTYFVMLPAAVPFLYNFMRFRAAWRPSAYFGLVTNLMFWIGISFQLPLIIYFLAAAGFVQARQLARQWRIAVVAIALIAAAVTPTVDPVNMALVMLPLIMLYFLSVGGAYLAQMGRKREQQKRESAP